MFLCQLELSPSRGKPKCANAANIPCMQNNKKQMSSVKNGFYLYWASLQGKCLKDIFHWCTFPKYFGIALASSIPLLQCWGQDKYCEVSNAVADLGQPGLRANRDADCGVAVTCPAVDTCCRPGRTVALTTTSAGERHSLQSTFR